MNPTTRTNGLGIVDTGATKTVIGSQHVKPFFASLGTALRQKVTRRTCQVLFRFGNQGTLESSHALIVPLGPIKLRIAIVPGLTPLLLSNTLMRVLKANMCMVTSTLQSPHLVKPIKLHLSSRGLFMLSVDDLAHNMKVGPELPTETYLTEDSCETKTSERSESHVRVEPCVVPEPVVPRETSSVSCDHGRACEAHAEPGERAAARLHRHDDVGGTGSHQGFRGEDPQRGDLQRDVAQSSGLGAVDAQDLRGEHQTTTSDASPLRGASVGQDGGGCHTRPQPHDQPHGQTKGNDDGHCQEQSSCFTLDGNDAEYQGGAESFRRGGTDLGDGRTGGHESRGGEPAERDGDALGPHGPHRVPPEPGGLAHSADHSQAAERSVGVTPRLEAVKPEESLFLAGDIDAEEPEAPIDVSGHDMALVYRLVSQYTQELVEVGKHYPRTRERAFLFEVFCGSNSNLTRQCHVAGRCAQRFHRERGDLDTVSGRFDLFYELNQHQPDHVWYAPTCTVWSGWSALNGSRSLAAHMNLQQQRVRMLQQVALGLVLLRYQRFHGRHMHWEQPTTSAMNRLACLRELRQTTVQAHFDMCVVGDLRCPQSDLPMKKSTIVHTTHAGLYDTLHGRRCTRHASHQTIEGSVRSGAERMNRSQFSEQYTRKFARCVIQALSSLRKPSEATSGPGWALAADADDAPPAKRARLHVPAAKAQSSRRQLPIERTSTITLNPEKRRRLEGKQSPMLPDRVRDAVKAIHAQVPRVGRIEIIDPTLLEALQTAVPDRVLKMVVACRGTDRTMGPPASLRANEAPWRKAIMIRRSDGQMVMETEWEDWSRLPKYKVIRTNHSCRLNITLFASDHPEHPSPPTRDLERAASEPAPATEMPPLDTLAPGSPSPGCSAERLSAETLDPHQHWSFQQLSMSEKQWLAKVHKNMGHPSPDRLAQMLWDQGYAARMVEAARHFLCSSCHEGKHASLARPATLRDPLDFNDRVSMDAFQFRSRQSQTFRVYHIVDHGTSFQTAFVVASAGTESVIDGLTQSWLCWAGAPGQLRVDAGTELNSAEFGRFLQANNIQCLTVAPRAHWQNGRAERHGAVLKHMLQCFNREQAISSMREMQQALWAMAQAKNALSIRRGYSPEVLVLGKATRLPGSVVSDESTSAHLQADQETSQGLSFRTDLIRRDLASKAFHDADNAADLRRAVLRRSRPDRQQYAPGEWIMMLVQRGNLPNQTEWLGPMQVLTQSNQHIVWASVQGRIYRAAPEHCRPVSSLEAQRIPTSSTGELGTELQEPGPSMDTNQIPESSRPPPVVDHQHQRQPSQNASTTSQPDHEPEFPASEEGSAPGDRQPDGGLIPVPDSDTDALFVDEDNVFQVESGVPLAWRTEITISDRDIDAWRTESNLSDMAFMAAASKKQHSEIKLSELTPAEQELFAQAKASEIQNWLSNQAVEKVVRSQIPPDQVLRCRWILTWKALDPSEVTDPAKAHKPKARLVVLGYLDPDLENIPRDSPTLGRNSRMLILQLIASQAWKLQSFDVKAAFLQGQPQKDRVMGLEPTEEFRKQFNMKPDQILRLVKGAYGLVDAPFLWYQALRGELLRLGMEEAPWDPTVYILRDPKTRRPKGIIGMHVDDGLCGGDAEFEELLKRLEKKYAFGSHKVGRFTYTGIELSQKGDGSIVMSQSAYVRAVTPIPIPAERKLQLDAVVTSDERHRLRGLIGSLQYAAINTRPDLCSRLGQLQSSVPHATVETLMSANRVLHEAKLHHEVSITLQPIPADDIRFLAFCDASFASKKCPDSHAGSVIMCAHKDVARNITSQISPIAWSSKKIQKVVTSTLAAETMSLNSTLDQVSWLKLYWAWILDNSVPWRSPHEALKHVPTSYTTMSHKDPDPHITATDCKSLYDLITRTAPAVCSEFRTQLHARAIKDLLAEGIQMRWVHSGAQVADALTKLMPTNFLRETLKHGRYQLSDEQSILKQRADNRQRVRWLHETAIPEAHSTVSSTSSKA